MTKLGAHTRGSIYVAIAVLTTLQGDLTDISSLSEIDALKATKMILASLITGLTAFRAYIDQSLTKEQKPHENK